ncbi:MAG: serine/threonine-protein kinase [Myxococcota bacterium]
MGRPEHPVHGGDPPSPERHRPRAGARARPRSRRPRTLSERPPRGVRSFAFAERLGEGASGEVYRAIMTGATGDVLAPVAVKILKDELLQADRWKQRLRDEARHLAAVDHPAIVRVLDLVPLDGHDALVTEYIDGADLSQLIRGRSRIPLRPLYQVLSQAADALDAAYEGRSPLTDQPLHVVHRDVKPSNLRVGRHGQAKLVDFGIALGDLDRSAHTDSGTVVGSLAYMAPERFDAQCSPASDIFSLGCVLYEGLSGQRLQEECTSAQLVMRMALAERFVQYADKRMKALPNAAWDAVDLMVEMLAFDPARRPTAAQVATRLEEMADHAGGESLRSWCRKRTWPSPTERGRYSGLTLTEPRPAPLEAAPAPPAPVPPSPRRWPLVLLGVVVGITGSLLVVAALLAGGSLAWSLS